MVSQNQQTKITLESSKELLIKKKKWHKTLTFSLWADRITQRASIGTFPFHLVYGKEDVIPSKVVLPSLALVQFIDEVPSSSLQLRMSQILKMDEESEKSKITHAHH